MKLKTVFLILGGLWGVLIAKRVYSMICPETPTIQASSVMFEPAPGSDLHSVIRKLIEAAKVNEIPAFVVFNGVEFHANPGDGHMTVWDRYLDAEVEASDKAEAQREAAEKAEAEKILSAIPETETATGRDLRA